MERGERTKLSQWLSARPQMTVTFLSAIIFGIVVHGMGLFNKFSAHDDIQMLFGTGATISSGRWMLHVIGWLETIVFGPGHFSLPLSHGLFSILCIAASACMLVNLLGIKHKAYCAALAGIMVAFPAVAGYFGYMYTMPYYMLAMLMTVIAACMLCGKRAWWQRVVAILLGGCAAGIYQAFLPLMLSIPLLYDLMWLSENEGDWKAFLRQAAFQVLCMVLVMVFYFAASRFFLTKFNLELDTYMGINQMESTPLADYLARVGKAYRAFFWPERNVAADIFPMHVFYVSRVLMAASLLLAVRLVIRAGRKNRGMALMMALLFALMPLACNFIYVMSAKVHGLMTYGQVMQLVLFIWLADGLELSRPDGQRILSGAMAGVLGLTCVMYARYDNQCYLKAVFQQQEAISWMTTLAAQIKSTEGYRDDLPVAFMNQEKISDETLCYMDELDFIHMAPYDMTMEEYVNSYGWRKFMERWCGFGPAYANEAAYVDLPEVREMPHYPDDGSIQNLGDVIIVNF